MSLYGQHRVWARHVCRVLCAVLLACLWGTATAHAAAGAAGAAGATMQVALDGSIVQSGLSGFEPDFDPIDRVVVAATLRDTRTSAAKLPNSMLVLSAYLENFKPDTTPVLPDLLHQDQTATGLGGFMTGKAALVNAAGHISYRGSLLAEVFLDNSVHLVLDLQPSNAPATAPSLRVQGIFTLNRKLAVQGTLQSTRPLSHAERALLLVPHGPAPSWQTVVRSLIVRPPRMMGTAGSGAGAAAAPQAAARPALLAPWRIGLAGALAALVLLAGFALRWRRGAGKGRHAGPLEDGEATAPVDALPHATHDHPEGSSGL